MVNKVLPKPSPSNKQIQEYMTAVRKGISSQFIIHMENGTWNLRPALEPKQAITFDSKELAIKKAKQNAKTKKGTIFIFGQDGSLIAELKA